MADQPPETPDAWQYFRWRSPQLADLIGILGEDLARRRQPYEIEHNDPQNQNDADELSIARGWCRVLAPVVERWCALLEIDPTPISEFRRAKRAGEKFGLIDPEPLVSGLLKVCLAHPHLSQGGFRPRVLEHANREILEWLSAHPSDVDRLHHRTFEAVLKEVIAGSGWSVELTKRTRDGGYDLACLANSSVGSPIKMVVELKLFDQSRKVGISTVDRIVGVASREAAERALVVTNSRFSKDVWARWQHRVGRDLELVAREELLDWLSSGIAITMSSHASRQPTR